MNMQNNKQQAGFSLVEMLIALSIFSIVVVIVMYTFVGSFASQKRIIEMHVMQREGAYLLERISRDVRMAQNIEGASGPFRFNGTSLTFRNNEKKEVSYCRSNSKAVCDEDGDYIAYGNVGNLYNISVPEIKVENLWFSVSPQRGGGMDQPLVTIVLTLHSTKDPRVKITMQTSIATRNYQKN